ncbi:hypothetical protein [Nonomuraea rhodomycinica]|uniref:Uncharacterized protein n=1 Tax=Nonomuraea rhodomycinica TaxID=1712872 RepID=A0A7Y6IPJ7_9ACTN|nr:hypothetical protein [Nonomuraea rhodomycinica]NUW41982.1 hypothetical protein [Nonomuraea rhodomycinica]
MIVSERYRDACFEIRATTPAGDDLNLGDGGFVTWSADLLGNAKERLLISGLGLERLCERFGPPTCGDQIRGPSGRCDRSANGRGGRDSRQTRSTPLSPGVDGRHGAASG